MVHLWSRTSIFLHTPFASSRIFELGKKLLSAVSLSCIRDCTADKRDAGCLRLVAHEDIHLQGHTRLRTLVCESFYGRVCIGWALCRLDKSKLGCMWNRHKNENRTDFQVVVEENGALSAADGYCIHMSILGTWYG